MAETFKDRDFPLLNKIVPREPIGFHENYFIIFNRCQEKVSRRTILFKIDIRAHFYL